MVEVSETLAIPAPLTAFFAANQNITVYMFADLDTHIPFILADN